MDPLLVAEKIATTDRNNIVTNIDIASELKDGGKRVGGRFARGKKWILHSCNKNVIKL